MNQLRLLDILNATVRAETNRRLDKEIRTFKETSSTYDVPKNNDMGRVGADGRRQQAHDEVKEVEDEDVYNKNDVIVVVNEQPRRPGRTFRQRDPTDGSAEDAAGHQNKNNKT